MFSMHDFIMTGFMDAIGKMPDYWIVFNSEGYQQKGILTEIDLANIQDKINQKNVGLNSVHPDIMLL